MGQASSQPFHMKDWLSVQQALDYLSALAEEPLTSETLAKLAEDHHLDLYWHRRGQLLTYRDPSDRRKRQLDQPLRLCSDNLGDWRAIVGILRNHPALPATENDTPSLQDSDGNLLHITFDFNDRPEPYSARWYPNYSELALKRSDLERLESRLFTGEGEVGAPIARTSTRVTEEPLFLLDVIAQLEKLAMAAHDGGEAHEPDTRWLAQQLASGGHLDRAALERVLTAAERRQRAD